MAVVARIRQVQSVLRAESMLTDQVGDAVYIRGDIGVHFKVARADVSTIAKMPAIGIIIKKWDFTQVLVQTEGVVTGIYSGLVANQTYWIGANGQPSATPPPIDGATLLVHTQVLGMALDASVLLLRPAANIFTRQ